MSKPNRTASGSTEVRCIAKGLRVERRAEGGGAAPVFVGHAAVFDAETVIYESEFYRWTEVVRRGAFRNALAEAQDVRALFNHDANYVIGRTASGTLSLAEDAAGLLATFTPPDIQWARDLMVSVERGDVTGMSFGFRVRPGGERSVFTRQGSQEREFRELLDLDLSDVSIVTYPAYDATSVAIRSRAEAREVEAREARRIMAASVAARIRLAEVLAK